MPKIDVNALPIPDTLRETHTFVDQLCPSTPLVVTFEVEPDYALFLRAQALGQRYVTERLRFPISVGKSRKAEKPTEGICRQIGIIQSLEAGEAEDRYAFEEWFALSKVLPNAFAAVVAKCDELIAKAFGQSNGDDVVPNDFAALGPLTSEPHSNTTAATTPTSSPGSPQTPTPKPESSEPSPVKSVPIPTDVLAS